MANENSRYNIIYATVSAGMHHDASNYGAKSFDTVEEFEDWKSCHPFRIIKEGVSNEEAARVCGCQAA